MAFTQPDIQAGDELASLFSRNMTFQQPQPVQEAPQEQHPPEPEPIKYSISQHYHHSTHIVQQEEPISEPLRPSSVPPQILPTAEQILSRRGIDPSWLSPQQLELFKTADTPQQLRLIQLWQICPPSNMTTNPTVAWINTTNTSVEQEEMIARLHYEQKQADEAARRDSLMSLDGTPLTPVQTTDGHWVGTAYVEPYMMSGYEMMARREYEESVKRQLQEDMSGPKEVYNSFGAAVGDGHYRLATDPVYANNWAHQQQAMENQYGAFQQMGDMEF
ncbi:hypothetical protein F5B22DRAFT_538860 [Xylaria bambusicola]|uniref:uncharacterized protein n=1 Tax=Xylaria bambusicola TaxID=326684 RepID=UPI002008D31B|nr:uncharacterized protein F5B22DRAFT_538860 [Xylaria bambusicola]KAI0505140.1 hypothetical protein F5B22DRAFT_538860 [Xylaria bambusicola]